MEKIIKIEQNVNDALFKAQKLKPTWLWNLYMVHKY